MHVRLLPSSSDEHHSAPRISWARAVGIKLVAVLKRKGLLIAASSTFGNFAAGPVATNDDTIAARQVSYGVGDLDDMTAALGRYWFRMTSAGSITATLVFSDIKRTTLSTPSAFTTQ